MIIKGTNYKHFLKNENYPHIYVKDHVAYLTDGFKLLYFNLIGFDLIDGAYDINFNRVLAPNAAERIIKTIPDVRKHRHIRLAIPKIFKSIKNNNKEPVFLNCNYKFTINEETESLISLNPAILSLIEKKIIDCYIGNDKQPIVLIDQEQTMLIMPMRLTK